MRLLLVSILVLITVGCSSSGEFTVGVVNKTHRPLSVGLVKNGPPMEPAWASPMEIDMANPKLLGRKWGTLVPPGEAVVIGPQKGKFKSGVVAILRVYAGDLPVEDLMAISPGNRERIDLPLDNGATGVVIRDSDQGLTASPAPPPPAR